MRIALSTDHAGFAQLNLLEKFLREQGHECINYGPKEFDAEDDYPDFIFPAAKAVASGECELGIIMGGSGQGEAMAANRIKGARCMVYYGPAKAVGAVDAGGAEAADEYEILRLSKQHNDANMISFAARFVSQSEIEKAAGLWLDEKFSGAKRHSRRIAKLDEGL
jgi:ribose 5-phosphate isomerase B